MDLDRDPITDFEKYFRKWRHTNKCTQQVSPPRSGGHWLRYVIERCSGRKCYDTNRVPGEDFPNNTYFNNHWFIYDFTGDKYVLLVRDPRSVIWSQVQWGRDELGADKIDDLNRWRHSISIYRQHFTRYLSRNTLIAQYERICLFPVEEVTRVMNFIGYKIKNDIQKVVENLDRECFSSGYDRYKACCLKWKNDEFTSGHRKFVWEELGDIMVHYGYNEQGHSPMLFIP